MCKINEHVSNYWLKYYIGSSSLCTLCGNTGIIDTSETAISPKGIKSGCINFCICPNGQSLRFREMQEENAKYTED